MAAIPDYTQKIDTLTTVAIDEATKDVANLVTEGGEKLLKKVQSNGRIFVVNDAEKVKHPVMFGSGTSQYFDPDTLAPSSGTGLGTAAEDILGFAQFHMYAATRNINYPQAMPAGNFIPYISSAIKMHMMDILNKEEQQFLLGVDELGASAEVAVGPLPGDLGATAGLPMSLAGLVNGRDTGSTWKFAGIDQDDATYSKWLPQIISGGGTATPTEAQVFGALDEGILSASFSEAERPDWILTTKGAYKYILDLMRDKSRINDAVLANLGTTDEIPYAGTFLNWSRYLAADKVWDTGAHVAGGSAGTAADIPVVGINTNSLRLNVVSGGGVTDEKLGFVQKIGSTQKHAAVTNLFDRVQYKRCWSVDNGRRSFFSIHNWTI